MENIYQLTHTGAQVDDAVEKALRITDEAIDSANETTDYIVEQGTSGIWQYRKWNSGIYECWGVVVGTLNSGMITANYPITFVGLPCVNASSSWSDFSGSSYIFVVAQRSTNQVLLRFKDLNNATPTGTAGASVHAIGRWK